VADSTKKYIFRLVEEVIIDSQGNAHKGIYLFVDLNPNFCPAGSQQAKS
jgi:hypothetical protein